MRRAHHALSTIALLALAAGVATACGDEATPSPSTTSPVPPPAEAPARVTFLTPTRHLVRASMALRGTRPSVAELRAVAADPEQLPVLVDGYLASPELGATLRELHDEALKVKIAPVLYPAGFPARGSLARVPAQRLNDAVTDAPLRLVQHVIENDRPYSEIVTADYTVADGIVSQVWGMPYDGDGTTWQETRYADGREHAGILSDSFLFTRHSTTYSNANRGRANAVSSALLCYDFLTRDIDVDATIDLANPAEVANAAKENAACASCHQTLDPLAAYFAGYRPQFVPTFEQSYPIVFDTGPLASVFSTAEPAYFGHEGRGLRFLGSMIAQDPRFSLCTAKRFYAYLNQIPVDRVPLARASELQRTFVASGLNAKALLRAIVLGDDFRTSGAPEDAPEPAVPGLRKVRARELGRLLRDLTGTTWETEIGELNPGSPYDPGAIGRVDLLADSFFGYAVLFGGTDALYVTRPSHTMNATAAAVLRAVASRAAADVVERDFAEPDSARRLLLRRASLVDASEPLVREVLAELHARLFGELAEPGDEDVSRTYALFRDALASAGGDVRRAWTVTLFAMLQDVRLVFT